MTKTGDMRCILLIFLFWTALADAAVAAASKDLNSRPARTETIRKPGVIIQQIDPMKPSIIEQDGDDVEPGDTKVDEGAEDDPTEDKEAPKSEALGPPPKVHYDEADLPNLVARMRSQIMDAARSGDVEELRPVLEANEVMPTLAFDEVGDPIDYLKSVSGDTDGREILAILLEVMEAGFVHVDIGTPQEMYIWPYFARYPLTSLTPQQTVEMFRILTAHDLEEMKSFGAYVFYRVGIGPDGTWHYFVSGD